MVEVILFLLFGRVLFNMYKLDIPLDLKEKAAIERRRRAEKERQGRVFNSKYRQTGVRSDQFFFFYLFIFY